MSNLNYDCELKQTFNNSTYYVRALNKDRILYIEVEEENTGYKWKNEFVNSYIEEMTRKTGNFKTFDRFCIMIYSALNSNNTGSVFIDLLSYQDLEILKARNATKYGIQSQSLNTTQRTKNKRYLILTYIVEFDRVHYPLALKLDENRMNDIDYPSDKLTDIIKVLEDEIKILKKELEKKNFEICRITRNTKEFKQKYISKHLDDLKDEIERLSTELLSERTKYTKINRQFNDQRYELNKKIEILEASNYHYKQKCHSLKNEVNATKQILDNLRIKASKQRLYSSSSSSLKRAKSRSKSRKKSRKKNRNNLSNNNNIKYQRSKYQRSKYQRSSSAPRFKNKRNYKNYKDNRSRSPSIRFDPTLWAKKRKEKIEKSKLMRNTFGKSRSPSPFRYLSRSQISRSEISRSVTSISSEKIKKKNNNKKKRDRSNSRKRNSFGTTISISPKSISPKSISPKSISPKSISPKSINNDDNDDDDDESLFNPTKEIESIDSRLNALQKFLRAAKSSS